jgi:serine phosphatase RsbU (regulator of sigma subunit)
VERLEAFADPLHPAFSTWHFEQRMHPFSRGEILLAFTDGLIESRRAEDDEPFGIERLEQAVARAPRDSAAAFAASLREALAAFQGGRPPEDDLTILVARRL